LLLITAFPICYSFYVSLTGYNLTIPGSFEQLVGFKNYVKAFQDPEFISSILNTVEIAIPALTMEVLIGFALALVLNRRFAGRGLVLALLVVPFMIAPAAAALAWRLLFDSRYGPVNYLISQILGHNVVIDWLGSTKLAIRSLTIIDIWQTSPFVMLILLAGLSAISPELYESAKIDGANHVKTFRYITLPLVQPVLSVAVLFRSIDLLKMFDICYALTKGGPAGTTSTLSYYTYKQGLGFAKVGYGSTISFIVLVAVAILSGIYLRATLLRKGVDK
jgi:multiple sugar transport system permease protein